MKKIGSLMAIVMTCLCLFTGCLKQEEQVKEVKLDPDNPITITLWHYYNGAQQTAFDEMTEEFNETVGREKGIYVETYAQGDVYELQQVVMDAADKKAGASEMPDIFSAYADTAYEVNERGLVADLRPYLTKAELAQYVDSYIEEGAFDKEDELKIFPIAKATEVLVLNETDWKKFAKKTGVKKSDLSTIEGLVKVAGKYYDWSEGKAFFGRDSVANYIYVGAKQLGIDIISVEDGKTKLNLDREVMKKIWDCYYVPYVKGWFSSEGRFRSDDMQMGNVIAYVGSSSGASFYPTEVSVGDEEQYPIKIGVYESPKFKDGESYAVQQGAGMVVTNKTDEEVYASIEFLKWFTDSERNMTFSTLSSYLPVKKEANSKDLLLSTLTAEDENVINTLSVALDTVNNSTMYTPKATSGSSDIRSLLENALQEQAEKDRKSVEKAIKKGKSYKKAVKPYLTEETFDAWYEEVEKQLSETME
ncbi:MAG: extracellular solute-binding protein [Lachnospiraceae bacterium]|nr:extracellular solute-binding protein [Lachnospiraceae bacterium]